MIRLLLSFLDQSRPYKGYPHYGPKMLKSSCHPPYPRPDFTTWCMLLGVSSRWMGKPDAYKHA
jgi:hypothetical protein